VPNETVFDASQVLLIKKGQPQDRLSVSAMLDLDSWTVIGRMTHYGEVSTAAYVIIAKTCGANNLFDMTAQWHVSDQVDVSAGILNLTNEYPDEWRVDGGIFPEIGFKYGWQALRFHLPDVNIT
jgi:iron complex outermembrane receptor protein